MTQKLVSIMVRAYSTRAAQAMRVSQEALLALEVDRKIAVS